jgi:hypothetical protein
MTEAVDEAYRELVEIHGRQYQKLSIDRRIYLVPVDEVRKIPLDTVSSYFQPWSRGIILYTRR